MNAADREPVRPGAAGLAATACVRVRNATGEVVGSGFLVGPDLVATCAHIVAAATGCDPFAQVAPEVAITIDFPVLPSNPVSLSATMHRWVPIEDDGTGDVALLRLGGPTPAAAVMPPFRRVDGLWDHRFRVFGFPESRSDGVWATGQIRSRQATGWCQLQGTPGDQQIEGGFSGSPVWDEESGAVVGMTVAADGDPRVTTAYLIPIDQVLGLDPELMPSPYRGLEPFEEEHAEYFFGRDPEISRLREAVRQHPLVVLTGPSGSGKSSLVHAGLLPVLRSEDARIGQLRPRPGEPIFGELSSAVLGLADPGSTAPRRARDADRIGAALTDPATRTDAITELTDALAVVSEQSMVLVIDQFEELAESTPDMARELLAVLTALIGTDDNQPALRVVVTMRGVALDEVLTPAVTESLGKGTVLLAQLDRTQLRAAIVRPAERAPGLAFEDGLVDRILDDAGSEPGQLPLVESLLAQLWARRKGGALTNQDYQDVGGVDGALAAHAERVVDGALDTPAKIEQLRLLCTRLAVPGLDGRWVRRPLRYSELPDELRELVGPLAAGRLIVVSGPSGPVRDPAGDSGGTIELAHQSLIEHWPRLRDWLDADREFLTWRSELDADRQRWEASGRDDDALRRGAALISSARWAESRAAELTEGMAEYLRRSTTRRHRELRRRRVVAAALVLIVGTLAVVVVRANDRIAAQRAVADAVTLARESTAEAQRDPILAAELALAAWHSDPHGVAARNALAARYAALSEIQQVVAATPGDQPILGIATAGSAPGGAALLNWGPNSIEVANDLAGVRPTRRPVPDPTGADEAVFSAGGRYLLYRGGDGGVRLWNMAAGAAPAQLAPPGAAAATLVGFSPDGARLAWFTSTLAGQVMLSVYDIASRTVHQTTVALPTDTMWMQLTRDPDLVLVAQVGVSTNELMRLTVRSLSRETEVRTLPARSTAITGTNMALSCTPGDLAGALTPSRLVVTDVLTGAPIQRIALPNGEICSYDYWVTSGGFVVEKLDPDRNYAQLTWQAIELATGRVHQFTTPPIDTGAWPADTTSMMSIMPGPNGEATAFVAVGPKLLKIPTSLAINDRTGEAPLQRFPLADGRLLADVDTATGNLTSYDSATGQLLARRPGELAGNPKLLQDDDLWKLSPTTSGWVLTRYPLPGLEPTPQLTLPSDRVGSPSQTAVDVVFNRSPGGPAQTVLALGGDMLSAWNAVTGQPIGQPVRLGDSPAQREWYQHNALLFPRLGHPTQALVSAPDNHLQLWDVPSGQLLLDLPIALTTAQTVAAQDDRLAALDAAGNLEVWNLTTGQRDNRDWPVTGANELLGFAADGTLVGRQFAGDEYIVLYNLDTPAEVTVLQPPSTLLDPVMLNSTRLWFTGVLGWMPISLAVTADQWRDKLCQLLPGPLSPAAQHLLPPDTQLTQPCAPRWGTS